MFSRNVFLKKLTAIVTVAILLAGIFPTTVFANSITVQTSRTQNVTNNSATVFSEWFSNQSGQFVNVVELGVIIETNSNTIMNNNPNIHSGNSQRVNSPSNTPQEFRVDFHNLQNNTTYFVRAYAIVRFGGSQFAQEERFFAPQYLSFTTGHGSGSGSGSGNHSNQVQTNNVTLWNSVINAQGSFPQNNHNFQNVTERGFVFSSTNSNPTNHNSDRRLSQSNMQTNQNNIAAEWAVSSASSYFVRAYVISGGQTFYGNTVQVQSGGGSSGGNNVRTDSATFSNAMISARGSFPQNHNNFNNVTERGFVASASHNNPTVDNGTRIISQQSLQTNQHNIAAEWAVTSNASSYNVRAYVISGGQVHYGDTIRVNITSSTIPVVFTRSAEMTGSRQARVTIDVTQSGQSQVFERGVVFSDTAQTPQINQHNVSHRTIQGGLGEVEVTLENLQPNTRYFVRSFARNNQGIAYGQVIELFTVGANAVQTQPATNISETGFTANGTVTNAIEASQIRESGFVFSTTNRTPTLSDQRVSFSNNRIGDFYMNIPNLARDTVYFVRAYTIIASTSGSNAPTHTIFGDVIEVRTVPQEVDITVNFLTVGAQANVGTQQITANQGTQLTASQLQVPTGFSLFQPQWTINVSAQMTEISVLVEADIRPETAFISGTGNFTFSPNRAATRAEVAQILYNLSTSPSTGTPIAFGDVPANHPNRRAIDYVSSRLVMRGDAGANTFRPNDPITRAEITVVLTNFYSLSGAATSNFPDVASNAWYFLPVSLAFTHNMVAGYEDGTFGPHRNITRAEVTTIFVRGENRSQQPLSTLQFTDVPPTHWAYRFIMNASIPQQ